MKRVIVLGSTGSIGKSTLRVIRQNREIFRVEALAAETNWQGLVEQVREFSPAAVAVASEESARCLKESVGDGVEVFSGSGGMEEMIDSVEADVVVMAVSGAASLRPMLRVVKKGVLVALANKECIVMAGRLLLEEARRHGSTVVPVDSEHSAVFQSLRGEDVSDVRRLILTASGGPFRDVPLRRLRHVSAEEALRHPTWTMGTKITIDSATMMNKALEVVEAVYLFDMPPSMVEVLIHPESVIHSMVEFVDGSVLAQMSHPDMAVPIAFALGYPERIPIEPMKWLDLVSCGNLSFYAPDVEKFPALRLGFEAARSGNAASTAMNAANEVAVDAFLDGRIGFLQIAEVVERVMEVDEFHGSVGDVEAVLSVDERARKEARAWIETLSGR